RVAARARSGLPGFDGLEQHGEIARRRRVVHAGAKRGRVLDAAQDLDVARPELVRGRVGVLRADELDERVRGQVARSRDHVVDQVANRDAASYKSVSQAVGVVAGAQRIGGAVGDRYKMIHQGDGLVEAKRTRVDPAEQLDHHRDLHGARGVKAFVRAKI